MKKIIIPLLVFALFGSVIVAADLKEVQDTGTMVENSKKGQEINQSQQTQTEQKTQNKEGEQKEVSDQQNFILGNQEKARTMNEAKEMIQQKKQEMTQEMQELSNVQQKVYQNQNKVREAVHTLLSLEDLATGIGPQVSQIAHEFNNSVQATITAEEKIQKRNAFVRFFIGGEKNAAEDIEQEWNQNQQRVKELKQLKEECTCGEEIKIMIQEQVQNMEQEQERLQQLTNKEKNTNGLFGWIKSLFKRGR